MLVEVERGGMVESRHRGHVVLVDESGEIVAALGDPDVVVYPRSAVKPLQAAAMLRAGLNIDGSALALAAASHSGEQFHIDGVLDLLDRAGLSQADLRCPPDRPYGERARDAFIAAGLAPSPVVMNCSGKHAAMLWACVLNDWPIGTYLDPAHPLQVHLRSEIHAMAASPAEPASVDGCGAPLWGLPLVGLARAFVALPTTVEGARVCDAMRDHPEYIGGTDRDVTALMRGVPGLLAKDGAESVQAMLMEVSGRRFGVALKIEDGAQRARPVVASAALAALGVDAPIVLEHQRWPVLGGGEPVGWTGPSPMLAALAVAH